MLSSLCVVFKLSDSYFFTLLFSWVGLHIKIFTFTKYFSSTSLYSIFSLRVLCIFSAILAIVIIYLHEAPKKSVLWASQRQKDPLERSLYDSYYPICNEISRETQTNPDCQMCYCNNLVACNKTKCYYWRKARHVISKIIYIYYTLKAKNEHNACKSDIYMANVAFKRNNYKGKHHLKHWYFIYIIFLTFPNFIFISIGQFP